MPELRPHLFALCPSCGSPHLGLVDWLLVDPHIQQQLTTALLAGLDVRSYTAEQSAEVKARPWFCECAR